MAYKQQLGRGKINSFSAFEAKGLIEGGGDDPMVTAETRAINRRATINTIKEKLTPDFSGLGGRLSRKVSQMKPGVMRNVALNVSRGLMGKKSNDSDQQMTTTSKDRQTLRSGGRSATSHADPVGCLNGVCTKP